MGTESKVPHIRNFNITLSEIYFLDLAALTLPRNRIAVVYPVPITE
jgi:hypothetical protein